MLKPPGPLVLDRAAVERLALGLMCMFSAALSFSAATSAAVVDVGRSMSSGLPAVWASMECSVEKSSEDLNPGARSRSGPVWPLVAGRHGGRCAVGLMGIVLGSRVAAQVRARG